MRAARLLFSSRALSAISRTASNSSRCTTSMVFSRRSAWPRRPFRPRGVRPGRRRPHRSSAWRIHPVCGWVRWSWAGSLLCKNDVGANPAQCKGADASLLAGACRSALTLARRSAWSAADRTDVVTAQPLLPLAALAFPDIDPVMVRIGPLAVHWYGVGYIVGILFGWWYAKRLFATPRLWADGTSPMKPEDIDDFIVWAALGIVLGGRLGYILFYDLPALSGAIPLDIFADLAGRHVLPWRLRRHDAGDDPVCPRARHSDLDRCSTSSRPACRSAWARALSPISSIRELWGRVDRCALGAWSSPTAVRSPRHPSQLYEAVLEGIAAVPRAGLLTHALPQAESARLRRRRLRLRLWAVAHLRRVLPRAGSRSSAISSAAG